MLGYYLNGKRNSENIRKLNKNESGININVYIKSRKSFSIADAAV